MKFLATLIMLFCLGAIGWAAPENRRAFCSERVVPHAYAQYLFTENNLLSFANPAGFDGGGLCWWHSRFERNAAYLVFFSPEKQAPTKAAASVLIQSIVRGDRVVEVPGYSNLRDFSIAFALEITSALNSWKIRDTVGFAWVWGLSGSEKPTVAQLQKTLLETYQRLNQKNEIVVWLLQSPGIMDSHSFLVLKMEKTPDGYLIWGRDSNVVNQEFPVLFYPANALPDFREHSTTTIAYLERTGYGAPYLITYLNREAEALERVGQDFCRKLNNN